MSNLMLRPTSLLRDMSDFRRDFDRIFDRFFNSNWTGTGEVSNTFNFAFVSPVEAWIDQNNKQYCLRVALPGVDPSKVDLQAQGNTLTIRGEHETTRQADEVDYLHREITYGAFERTVVLPEGVDANKLKAEYRDGLLEITAPVAAHLLPRRIEVKTLREVRKAA